jgi:hypothetical protein
LEFSDLSQRRRLFDPWSDIIGISRAQLRKGRNGVFYRSVHARPSNDCGVNPRAAGPVGFNALLGSLPVVIIDEGLD